MAIVYPEICATNCEILTASFTRPGDVNIYAVNDAVANSTSAPTILTFAGAGRVVGGSGEILRASITTDLATWTAAIRLHLFTTSVTPVNDNAQFPSLYANDPSWVGMIDFPGLTQEGTGSTCAFSLVTGSLPYVCNAASAELYGIPVVKNGQTPASAQNFNIRLLTRKN